VLAADSRILVSFRLCHNLIAIFNFYPELLGGWTILPVIQGGVGADFC